MVCHGHASAAASAVAMPPQVMQLSQCAGAAGGAGAPMAAAATAPQHNTTDADELLHIDTELQSLLCLQQQLQGGRAPSIQMTHVFGNHVPVLGSYSSEAGCLTTLPADDAVLGPASAEDPTPQGETLRAQAQQKLQQLLLIQQMERELQKELLSMLPHPAQP